MKALQFSILLLPYFFVSILADNAAMPYEILGWYYAYKAQWQSGAGDWDIYYHLDEPRLYTFAEWAPELFPNGQPWGGWTANAADHTTSPTTDNTNRLVQAAPPNARYELEGMNRQWDEFLASRRTHGGSLPGFSSMLDKMTQSLNKIWARAPNALSTADLGTMKEAMQNMMSTRSQVNWLHLRDWITNRSFEGYPELDEFLKDANGNYFTECDTDAILENIRTNPDAAHYQHLYLDGALQERLDQFGDATYGRQADINWSDWGGADTHSSVIRQGRPLVAFLEDKFTQANQLPTESCG